MTANSISNPNPISKMLVAGIVLLSILVLWLTYQVFHTGKVNAVSDPGSLIVRQVNEVSELTTATFEMDAVVPVSEKGFLAKSELLYIAHGNVGVGVNLSEFQANDVQVEGNKITVTLPPLKVLNSNLDLNHSSVYSYSQGFLGWGPAVVNLQAQAQREAIKKVEEAACQSWLIKIASDRVQKTVEHLLSQVLNSRGYEITVNTQPPSEGSCIKSYV